MNDLITKEMILLDLDVNTKGEVIEKLAQVLQVHDRLHDFGGFIDQVHKREETFPTSLGYNFAIPHGKCNAVKTAALAFARLNKEVQWSDEEKAKYVFLIAVSEQEAGDTHLKILAQLSRSIMREEFREKLEASTSVHDIINLLSFQTQ
ncbi:PTS sugar transporter subunit IIA [Geosporobacter ferrireducens]|uniref:PTS sugar transporter n=1 Tax=Geosporobacter ferrireducens TaxID=1424294 RepID=A0A1D8GD92_9FIRM|nr:fructose PTS transporter subunit IIA [Geosporobacter ferrireducens]AOT68879.1 PTS sugar transporter [Geosporobacter ferrireducens]MTI54888.1 PTS sugar transporter subunit IIA [Geosporobacter ferrireducens]